MTVTGVLATHYHPDHVGGSMMGMEIDGIASLLDNVDCPIHIQAEETEWVQKTTDVDSDHLIKHGSGDVLRIGAIDITLLHTPGHTPGSQCFLVDGKLVAGDTLFLDGCGRTDLPGSNGVQMIEVCNDLPKSQATQFCTPVTNTQRRRRHAWTMSYSTITSFRGFEAAPTRS